jgi:aryl-alcohol dehydrogenase-like predicted oxidoreductase
MISTNFSHTILGNTGLSVHRLGLSASYWPGKQTIYTAIDQGLNFFFMFGIDKQMIGVLRDIVSRERDRFIIATGMYNFIFGYQNIRKTMEKRLRQLRVDYIDVFMFLGILKEKEFPISAQEELRTLQKEGKARFIGISTHQRTLAAELAQNGTVDVLMIRYNAAHRGAEQEIFPYLHVHNPGVIGYTATRWRYLLRRPKTWPENGRIPDAGLCYRFVLSNPHVHVCLTAPRNKKQLLENIKSLNAGPLSEDDRQFMCEFGDAVHNQKKWFM